MFTSADLHDKQLGGDTTSPHYVTLRAVVWGDSKGTPWRASTSSQGHRQAAPIGVGAL